MHQPLAIAIIGGLIIALPLLLIVLPSFLRIIENNSINKKETNHENHKSIR
jgi:Cu/Ag efflux pump CusA